MLGAVLPGMNAADRKDIKPELLLEGIDSWLREPVVQRQISPSLAEVVKKALAETYMRLALLPTPVQPSPTASPKELVWCCIAFMAYNILGRASNEQKRLQIDKLLEHCNYPLTVFFKEQRMVASVTMPFFAKQEGMPIEALEQKSKLRELQISYVYSTAIMKRYKELFSSKFDLSTPSHPASDPNFRAGWLVYVVAKAKILEPHPNLVASFNLLVAVFNFLVVHMPRRRSHVSITDTQNMPVCADDGRVDTVASLASLHHVDSRELATIVSKIDGLLREILEGQGFEAEALPSQAQVWTSCQYWQGLLEDADIRRRFLAALEDAYLAANDASNGQYDEQIFLEPDISHGGVPVSPLRVLTRVSQYNAAKSSSHMISSGLATPIRKGVIATQAASPAISPRVAPGMIPGTPRTPCGSADGISFSDAISSTTWLREISGFTCAKPSEGLLRILQTSADSDKTAEVMDRVTLAEKVFPDSPDQQEEVAKVYYRVLESILRAEECRSGSKGVAELLNSNTFHKCMLACASEVVVACYKIVTLPFPQVPERLGLKAFDIFKIIQCFVRHEPTLPRGVKRHLVGIEEQVIESLSMAHGSSMFPSLVFAHQEMELKQGVQAPKVPQHARQVKRSIGFGVEDDCDRGASAMDKATYGIPGLQGLPKVKTDPRVGAIQHSGSKPPVSPRIAGLQCGTPLKAATSTGFHLIPSPAVKKLKTDEAGSFVSSPMKQEYGGLQPQGTVFSRTKLPQSIGEAIEVPTAHDGPILLLMRDFFRKSCILSWVRLAQLCENMDFAPYDHGEILAKVYSIVRFGIFQRTSLLYGRHLDQLILCSLYGVCKVLRLDSMTFKELTTHYKKQTGINTGMSLRQEVFRSVIIEFEGDTLEPSAEGVSDIISFYNRVFIPAMKPALMSLGSVPHAGEAHLEKQPQTGLGAIRTVPQASPLSRRMIPGSPLRKPGVAMHNSADLPGMGGPGVPKSPIKTQVANHNVFVSPMKDVTSTVLGAGRTAVTPRTHQLFCIGDTSPMVLAKTLADFGEATVAGAMEWQPTSHTSTDKRCSEGSFNASMSR